MSTIHSWNCQCEGCVEMRRFVRPVEEHDPLCSEGIPAGDQTMPCDCYLSRIDDEQTRTWCRECQQTTSGDCGQHFDRGVGLCCKPL